MLESLITSQTRIKLLLKFFLNSSTSSYLRGLADEFNESSNAIRVELNRFEQAGLLTSSFDGNKKMFTANTQHPLFRDIHNILMKHVGVDRVVNDLIRKLGHVSRAWLTGEMAAGRESRIIDIILVGENIDRNYLGRLTTSAEKMTDRKIRTLCITAEEEQEYLKSEKNALLLWEAEEKKRKGEKQ
ncbi:transcriptional regulator [Prolixibacter denitrificans]|uniref:Transcriptional regulator n=1 Tax=Prolixibacter denitrificans TaxID=1541063 RepID=A0ABQ0ZJF7_9BACT|nr:transcriptional regulator [Prolixibacter denitrificans]GET21592.1 transcriptional regulator [Prolixibacter denitrificans]